MLELCPARPGERLEQRAVAAGVNGLVAELTERLSQRRDAPRRRWRARQLDLGDGVRGPRSLLRAVPRGLRRARGGAVTGLPVMGRRGLLQRLASTVPTLK